VPRVPRAPRFDVELADDPVVALVAIQDDEVLGETLAVVVEALHFDGTAGAAARREEAVAVGDGRRPHFLDERSLGHGRAEDREGHDAATVEKEHPANRAAERQIAAPILEHASQRICFGNDRRAAPRAARRAVHVHGRLAAMLQRCAR
jgi:hypothetical protein